MACESRDAGVGVKIAQGKSRSKKHWLFKKVLVTATVGGANLKQMFQKDYLTGCQMTCMLQPKEPV